MPGGASEDMPVDGGAVTQGELLRREQEISAPPAPVASFSSRPTTTPVHGVEDLRVEGEAVATEEAEQPHARGPETIGPEDTGPQESPLGVGQVLDMEAAVGRTPQQEAKAEDAQARQEHECSLGSQREPGGDRDGAGDESAKHESRERKDADGDVVVTDADGVTEEEQRKHDVSGDITAPNAVDTTTR